MIAGGAPKLTPLTVQVSAVAVGPAGAATMLRIPLQAPLQEAAGDIGADRIALPRF